MLNFASKMINTLIGAPGEGDPNNPGQQQQMMGQPGMMMRNPQMLGQQQQRGMFQQQPQQQGPPRPGFPGQGPPGPQMRGPVPPGNMMGGPGGPRQRPPGPGGPGGPMGGPAAMGNPRSGFPPQGGGPRGPPGGGTGPPRGPPGPRGMMGPPGGPRGPMGPRGPPGPGGPGGPPGRFFPPNRPPAQQGGQQGLAAGPQGQHLRGPYPGTSPPGQQQQQMMRGPVPNHSGGMQQQQSPRPGYMMNQPQGPNMQRPPGMMIRPGGNQQHMMTGPQSGMMMQQHPSPAAAAPTGIYPDVDMSHLSEEERMLIESVMAKAQMEEMDASKPSPPGIFGASSSSNNMRGGSKGQLARQISQPETLLESHYGLNSIDPVNRRTSMSVSDMSSMGQQQQRLCNVCCRRDISGRDGPPGQPCSECRSVVCTTCGGYGNSSSTANNSYDNKNTVWLCRTCLDRRQQQPNLNWQQQGMIQQQQQQMMNQQDPYGMTTSRQQQQQQSMREYPSSPPTSTPPVTTTPSPALLPPMPTSMSPTPDPTPPPSSIAPADNSSDLWFRPIYSSQQDEPSNNVSGSSSSNRPFVDDNHRLRYQDIEDDDTHSNDGSDPGDHQNHHHHQGKCPLERKKGSDVLVYGSYKQDGVAGTTKELHQQLFIPAEDSDDSLLEELATVAVKEGSDSDENLSEVEDLNHHNNKEEQQQALLPSSSAITTAPSPPPEEESSPSSPPTSGADAAAAASALQQVYEHNPGEVYPIAEEEEEAASPTASDGVTSLRRRARLNSEGSGLYSNDQSSSSIVRMGSPIGLSGTSPYRNNSLLRPQRSLDGTTDTSSSSNQLNSHFGPSAIRFRSSQQHPDQAFKDERMPLSPPGMASGGVSNNTAVARMMMMSSSVADQQQQQTNLQQRMNQQQSNMAALQQQQQQQHQQLQNPMAAFNQDLMYDPNTGQQLYQQGGQHQPAGANKPAGTITGMLADFSRALGLGNNAAGTNVTRSSPSDPAFLMNNDPNSGIHQPSQQQHTAQSNNKFGMPVGNSTSAITQLQQQQQHHQQQSSINNQLNNPFGLAGQQTGSNYSTTVFQTMPTQQQQLQSDQHQLQMAAQQQQQQQQQQLQQMGQVNLNNPATGSGQMMSAMNQQQTTGNPYQNNQLVQQQQQLLQLGQINNPMTMQQQQQQQPNSLIPGQQGINNTGLLIQQPQQQQLQQQHQPLTGQLPVQQQPYGTNNTTTAGTYVQQVAQQFEQSGAAAVIAAQQPGMPIVTNNPSAMNSSGVQQNMMYPNSQVQPTPYQIQNQQHPQTAVGPQQTQPANMIGPQQQQQTTAALPNDPTGIVAVAAAGQQLVQQQIMMQQATAQLAQQQSIIQQQQQQLLMQQQLNNSSNADFMQMQHSKKHQQRSGKMMMTSTAAQQAALEQHLMGNKIPMGPTGRKNMTYGSQAQQHQVQAPAAALLHQSSIVPDPSKMGHTGDGYRTSDLMHKNRLRLLDGRPYSPTASPEIDMLMRPGPAAHSFTLGGTPVTTPMGTPAGTPRGGGLSARDREALACDSPDTLSETDSQASLRGRRKLPHLPPDQEAALLPSVQKKLELAKTQQQQQQQQMAAVQGRIKAYSNMRQGSATDATGSNRNQMNNTAVSSGSGLIRPTSESNLRQLAYGTSSNTSSVSASLAARPGSALGLLQGSSIVNANGLRSTVNLTGPPRPGTSAGYLTSAGKSEDQALRESLAAVLPPDLRHLVGMPATTTTTTTDTNTILNAGGLRTAALEDLRGSPLTRRRALEEELHRLTGEDRSRFKSEKDHERELRIRRELDKFAAMRDPMKRFDTQRRPGSAAASLGMFGSSVSPSTVNSSSATSRLRKGRGHRRQLSDPRVSSLLRDREESPSDRYSIHRSSSMNRSSKAYEYESLDELNTTAGLMGIIGVPGSHHYRSSSAIPTSYSGSALNRLLTEDDDFLSRKYRRSNNHPVRRSSDGGMTDYLMMDPSLLTSSQRSRYANDPRMLTRGLSYDLDRSGALHHHLHHQGGTTKSILSRKPRSWHPSPYGSDEEFIEEDDILTREAKKQRIKAEIARRRQQIEQNSRLHDELLRLSRLRDSGEVSGAGYQTAGVGGAAPYGTSGGRTAAGVNSSSVLRSINDILREDRDHITGRSRSMSGGGHMYDYSNSSPTRRPGYPAYGSHSRGASPARHHLNAYGGGMIPTEEERSMERLASTFRTEDYTSSLYERLHDFSPLTSDQELSHHHHQLHGHHHQQHPHGGAMEYQQQHHHQPGHHPHAPSAMPLLPDMPSRSRKLLEDLASEAPTMHIQSSRGFDSPDSGGGTGGYYSEEEYYQASARQEQTKGPGKRRYPFPVKRILLTCDTKSSATTDNGLGMRVVGGLEIPGRKNGEIGAFVTEICPGGVVDTHGEVQEGDQVLEWNGIRLCGKSFEEVQSIISSTRGEVEIVISGEKTDGQQEEEPVRSSREDVDLNGNSSLNDHQQLLTTASPTDVPPRRAVEPAAPAVKGIIRNYVKPVDMNLEDPEVRKRKWTLPLGQVQLLSCYDSRAHILYVTIIRARKLQTRRPNGDARPDPLVRCVLLPGRQPENERRTRYLSLTSDPEWHQTMVYPAVPPADLHQRQLEVTVWHHQPDGRLEFLGEFLLDMADPGAIDEQPHWYWLQDNSGGLASLPLPPSSHTSNNGDINGSLRNSMPRGSMSSGFGEPSGCHGSACTIL